mgnify:CR=1 FL=1
MAEKTIQEQIVREAPEVEAYKLGLLQLARDRANIPVSLPAYQIAGLAPEQQQAVRLAQQGVGSYLPYLQQAGTAYQQAGGLYAGLPQYGAQAIGALQGAGQYSTGQAQQAVQAVAQGSDLGLGYTFGGTRAYDPTSVYDYMNPYQQAATQATLGEIARQGRIAQTGIAGQAVRSGAFGGSREGIQRSELQRNILDQMARTAAQDYSTNYQQAQQAALGAFQNQQARMQQAGNTAIGAAQGVAGTSMQAGQLGLQAGQALGQANVSAGQLQQAGAAGIGTLGQQQAGLGQMYSGLGQGDVSFMYNLGGQLQSQQQKELDAQRQTALQAQYEPFQRISFLSDIYKGAPSSQQTIAQATAPSPSLLSQATGLGIAGLSAYNLMK